MARLFLRIAPALLALGVLGPALPATADETLPFRGAANEVVIDVTPLAPDLLQLTLSVTGNATHLGRFTGIEVVVLNTADGTLSGKRVFVAANGDLLYADVAGAFTSATTAEGTFTFTGGTGRFENASGVLGFQVVSPDGIRVGLECEGTIDY
jgi:hypothetical protein